MMGIRADNLARGLVLAAHIIAFFVLACFIINLRAYPYADDWTYVAPLQMHSAREFIQWLFAQHVDHRIPIQKFVHYYLAKHFGYDYRMLVFFDLMLALSASLMLSSSIRIYRGFQQVGDLIIPMIILSPVAGFSLWAFQFQFLSSIFFSSAAIYGFCKYSKNSCEIYFRASVIALFLCALCGMNGVITAAFLAAGILGYYANAARNRKPTNLVNIVLVALVIVECMFIWFIWTPSAASTGEANVLTVIEVFFRLIPSSMIVFTFDGAIWKIAFICLTVVLGAFAFVVRLKKYNELSLADFAMAFAIIAGVAVIASIAFGRSAIQGGWNNGLAMHYGYLTVLIPITSWFLLSRYYRPAISIPVGLCSILVFSSAYADNYTWRNEYVRSVLEKQRLVYNALKTEESVPRLVNEFALELTWQDTDDAKSSVINGLTVLRSFGYPIYALARTAPFSTAPVTSKSEISKDRTAIDMHNVVKSDGWAEAGEFNRIETVENYLVLGSYRTSDADTGALTIKVHRGDHAYYRTGPRAEHQNVEISEGPHSESYMLPQADGWTRIDFDSPELPEDFIVTFHDDGKEWGEWSAALLRKVR